MNLHLNLKEQKGTWINGKHPVFLNSEFEGKNFRVKIKPLTRTDIRKIREELENQKRQDQDAYLAKTCERQITDWELRDGEDKPIPYNEDNKAALIEQCPKFTNLIAAACLHTWTQEEKEREEEKKIS